MENETPICCLFTTLHKSSLLPAAPALKPFEGHLVGCLRGLHMDRVTRPQRDLIPARTTLLLHPGLTGGAGEAERKGGDITNGILPVLNSCFMECFVHLYLMLSTNA